MQDWSRSDSYIVVAPSDKGCMQRLENSELYAIFGTAMSMSIALHFLLIASHASLSFR